ncbi:72 kDa type IV collagenase isoform X2 [Lepeophtheirus salmonis]|uniref:72 kDa type IV collagenase isoform X2 n=1 Tax=Lepeophtheirus salmonis TaxID=72036 RepID=UPI001AE3D66C|nr:72 kDa type IV collagenase-like isoform X2 [Lepeophtheirus salmonis]
MGHIRDMIVLFNMVAVVPTLCEGCFTIQGDLCIFPFVYNGIKFDGCTNSGYGELFWCPTAINSTGGISKFGVCRNKCPNCTTVDGRFCVFPFAYKGEKYNKCTKADSGRSFWCATSLGQFGEIKSYGECKETCNRTAFPSVEDGCQTTTGHKCIFPFAYNGDKYYECVGMNNHGDNWCATSVNILNLEVIGYGNCNDSTCLSNHHSQSSSTSTKGERTKDIITSSFSKIMSILLNKSEKYLTNLKTSLEI